MPIPRLLFLLAPAAVLAACTINPRPVVVTPPPAQVVTTPAPVVTTPAPTSVMGAPGQGVTVEIPAGHYPPPGTCRIWVPGVPAGQQDLPGSCADLQNRVPSGGILLRG